MTAGKQHHRATIIALLLSLLLFGLQSVRPVASWSNGEFSTDPAHPEYGTHDFIAQHALDWAPTESSLWLRSNLAAYLYGTELPDNSKASDGIGDTANHHIYFDLNGKLQDDSGAARAQQSFEQLLAYLSGGDYATAAKWMGITSHYISDLAVFGHVMGKATVWGAEIHHSDYESWALTKTNRFDGPFVSCLSFDGTLDHGNETTVYTLAIEVAHDTTFDDTGKGHTAKWMDTHYNTQDPTFVMRTCESINHAVNAVADAIALAARAASIPEFSDNVLTVIVLALASVLVVLLRRRTQRVRTRL